MLENLYSIVDIETTGGHKNGHKIIEIAIINFDGNEIVDEWSSLINPERNIPKAISYLTGINNQMVTTSPKFYEVAKKIVEMTEGNIFVAHNVFFDYNFIKREFSDLGYVFRRDKLCTVRLARKALPGHKSYSLGKICSDLGISIDSRHRAMGDAKATVKLFEHIQRNQPDLLLNFINSESKKLSLPIDLDRSVIDNLPNAPGVYYFFDDVGELLYVGKAKDLNKRVISHFRPDMKRKKDIQLKSKIAHVDYKLMGSEFAALLFECHEIKKLRPSFNRAMNRKRFPYRLILQERKSGELLVKLTKSSDEESHLNYASRKIAEKARNSLYRAILGFDYGSLYFEEAKSNLIQKLGINLYNDMVKKNFQRDLDVPTDYNLKLPGRHRKENCTIEVRGRFPIAIIFHSISDLEKIELYSDQDMFQVFNRYLRKYNIKKHYLINHSSKSL